MLVSVPRVARVFLLAGFILAPSATYPQDAGSKRPMTFLDMQEIRQVTSPAPSPDGRSMLYALSTPEWKEGKRQTDIYFVSLQQGVRSTKQMTFTREKSESSPQWCRDSSCFAFLSNREAPESASNRNQLYVMRPDGGEAQRLTDEKDGVSDFSFSRDGRSIVYRAGKAGEEQLYRLPLSNVQSATPEKLTTHSTGVDRWQWSPDSTRIYFTSPDSVDPDDKLRREKKFTVNIRNPESSRASLWALDIQDRKTKRLTDDASYSVADVKISRDGKWIGFRGQSPDRYKRNITAEDLYSDLYLMNTANEKIERLTRNDEVAESSVSAMSSSLRMKRRVLVVVVIGSRKLPVSS